MGCVVAVDQRVLVGVLGCELGTPLVDVDVLCVFLSDESESCSLFGSGGCALGGAMLGGLYPRGSVGVAVGGVVGGGHGADVFLCLGKRS